MQKKLLIRSLGIYDFLKILADWEHIREVPSFGRDSNIKNLQKI